MTLFSEELWCQVRDDVLLLDVVKVVMASVEPLLGFEARDDVTRELDFVTLVHHAQVEQVRVAVALLKDVLRRF